MNMEELLESPLCLIGGSWQGDPVDPITNPADGTVLAHVPRVGAREAEEAVDAAAKAFETWSKTSPIERSAKLRRWFELIVSHKEVLATILTREQGKPLSEARVEIDYAASYIELYAEEAKRLSGEMLPQFRENTQALAVREPIGVVAAITPWNFPAAMITRKVAAALGAGCTVVLKPAPDTPLTAIALFRLAQKAEIPSGVLNLLTGDAVAIGEVLTTHPTVRMVTFTGSTGVGKLLIRQAASTVKKVAMELGGNAPFIVFDDADIDAAVEGAIASKFRNTGQTCVCANRFYIQSGVYNEFTEKLVEAVQKLRVGNGLEPDVNLGPLINASAVRKVTEHISDALDKGGQLLTGGKPHGAGPLFFEPTVIGNLSPEMRICHEETFGPVAAVMQFSDEKDVVSLANDTSSGLAAYFYSKDLARVFRVSSALEVGMVGVNTGSISAAQAPFGGIKESGIGREGSRHGIEEYTELKYVLIAGL